MDSDYDYIETDECISPQSQGNLTDLSVAALFSQSLN